MRTLLILCGFVALTSTLSGCVPLALGAGGAVAADEYQEDREGGDGLF